MTHPVPYQPDDVIDVRGGVVPTRPPTLEPHRAEPPVRYDDDWAPVQAPRRQVTVAPEHAQAWTENGGGTLNLTVHPMDAKAAAVVAFARLLMALVAFPAYGAWWAARAFHEALRRSVPGEGPRMAITLAIVMAVSAWLLTTFLFAPATWTVSLFGGIWLALFFAGAASPFKPHRAVALTGSQI